MRKPGVNVEVGDVLTRIDRVRLTRAFGPSEALVGKGGKEILLTRVREGGLRIGPRRARRTRSPIAWAPCAWRTARRRRARTRRARRRRARRALQSRDLDRAAATRSFAARGGFRRVRAMHSELDARYRDMIRDRADRVHALGAGAVGYLHLPDMERFGYSEFWRRFASASPGRDALVVDFRGNGGGHISELILAKLAQRPLAWDVPRRGSPERYPSHARAGGGARGRTHGKRRRVGRRRVSNIGNWNDGGRANVGGLLTVGEGATLVDGGEVSAPSRRVVLFDEDAKRDQGARLRRAANDVENRGVTRTSR